MIPDNLISSVYAHPEAVKKDVSKAVERYRALAWKFDRFVFNDGTCKNLLNLEGTIPIHFKGNYYNIPICIWLIDTHPNNAPICYVKPTPDMQIRPSSYVDQNGKIYLPYLHDWNPKSSDLLGLIQVMIVAFGDIPPLFTKKRENPIPAPTPYPTTPQVYMPMPGATQNYPPYPLGGTPMVQPIGNYQLAGSYPLSTPTPTPYPTSNMPSYPPYPPTTASASNSGTITDEHIKASLLTAVQDKVRLKMNDQVAQIRAELEILQQTSYELNQGKTKLLDIISKMEKEKSDLDRVYTLLKERDAELEKAKIDLEEKKEVDVDEAVITTAPLYKQILNAYAEEAAMEDAIYYMGEALRRSVIDLDVFLKQVRTLSRKQFMLRALMQKCRHKAGLAY